MRGWDHGTSLSGENIRLIMMLYPEPKTVGLIYFRTRRCRRLRGYLTNRYLETQPTDWSGGKNPHTQTLDGRCLLFVSSEERKYPAGHRKTDFTLILWLTPWKNSRARPAPPLSGS